MIEYKRYVPLTVKAAADRSLGVAAMIGAKLRAQKGAASEFGIFPGYRHRSAGLYFDDTANTDDWQKEVYQYAAALMEREGLRSVYDVGCGSGYKLVHYLGKYQTTGFDVPKTVEFLVKTYPDRAWRAVPFSERGLPPVDLVICSDVIEHVENPDDLLAFIDGVASRFIVISTPDRDLMYRTGSRRHYGPPYNPTHIREWSSDEFKAYVGQTFDVLEQRITNRAQATQMVVCERKGLRR